MPKVTDEHVEARRNQILFAACRCFIRKGFHQSTIRDICAEAGLSAGGVYRYFKSKEDIIEAMAELGRRSTRSHLESIAADEPAPVALEKRLTAFVDFLRTEAGRDSSRLDVRLWGEGLHTPQIQRLWLESLPNAIAPFADVVRRGQEQGEIGTGADPESVGTICVAICLGLNVLTALGPEDVLDGCRAAIAAVIRGSLSRPTKAAEPRGEVP